MKDTLWQRLLRGVCRLKERSDWASFAGRDWTERIMGIAVTDRFHAKQGRSTGRWVLDNGHGRLAVYLKRHYRLPRWRGWAAALWPASGWSPALQEWRHLDWARSVGMPVPAAVAACEYIGPWGRLQSFLAVEELAGMLPLHEAVPSAARNLSPALFRRWKRGLAREIARLSRELHDRRHFHKDFYLCHFYIAAGDVERMPDWRGRVHLIDFHRLAHHRLLWQLWQTKDLAQLLYSSEMAVVDDRDRLAFWTAYLGADRRPRLTRWLRRGIGMRARRYRQHNAKKQSLVLGR